MNDDLYILESESIEITANSNTKVFELEEYQLIVSANIESNIYNSDDVNIWLTHQ